MDLALRATVELRTESDVRARWTMGAGDVGGAILESGSREGGRGTGRRRARPLRFNETVRFWRGWLGRSTYTGRWREAIDRSAMTLQADDLRADGRVPCGRSHDEPARAGRRRAQLGLPFPWVRDASFSVYALLGLGYTDEALAFLRWLRDRVGDEAGRASGPLRSCTGSTDRPTFTRRRLTRFEDIGDRRLYVGIGASDQLQLDIYGEAMDSLYEASRQGGMLGHEAWLDISMMMDWLAEHWDEPKEGIWETRGGRKNFTYGRLMSWVAMDQAIRMAHELRRPADVARWTKERDRIYHQILDRGWNKERGAFVQHYDSSVLDASEPAHAGRGLCLPDRPDVAIHARCHERRTGLGQSSVPLRSRRVPRTAWPAPRNVLDLHVLVRRRPGSLGPARRSSDDVREDADIRQPRRAVLRGDRGWPENGWQTSPRPSRTCR